MARLARLVVPGVPYHIIQRGNRRQRTSFFDEDYAAQPSGFHYAGFSFNTAADGQLHVVDFSNPSSYAGLATFYGTVTDDGYAFPNVLQANGGWTEPLRVDFAEPVNNLKFNVGSFATTNGATLGSVKVFTAGMLGLTVSDPANPLNSETAATDAAIADLYVAENAMTQTAAIDISTSLFSDTSPEDVYLSITPTGGTAVFSGNLSQFLSVFPSSTVPLSVTNAAHDFTVEEWVDADHDHAPNDGEDSREVDVHVIDLKSLTVADHSDPTNNYVKTDGPCGPTLNVSTDANGMATVDVTADFDPEGGSGAGVHVRVTRAGDPNNTPVIPDQSFSGGNKVQLQWQVPNDSTSRDYNVFMWEGPALNLATQVMGAQVAVAGKANVTYAPTPSGTFTITTSKVPIKDPVQRNNMGGDPSYWGYTITYQRAPGVQFPAGSTIVLVQALNSDGGFGNYPHFDADDVKKNNYYKHQQLPPYGPPLVDRPYNARTSFSYHTWTITVAADAQIVGANGRFSDYILGCVSFTFYDKPHAAQLNLPGLPAILDPAQTTTSVAAAVASSDPEWTAALTKWMNWKPGDAQ